MSATLEQIQYGFDRNSRRTWQLRSLTNTQDQHYSYDALSQVSAAARGSLNLNKTAISGIPATAQSWEFDPTGNWRGYHTEANGTPTLDQHRVHDRGNRLTQIEDNPHNMILDRVGRMRQMAPDEEGDWDGKLELTWDAWSRITRVKNNGEVVGEYAYDGTHRRTTREVGSDTLHSYYNDAWRPLEERKDAETTASISYLWGARHRDDLARRDRAVGVTTLNETRYVLMDYFNPSAITDAGGTVKERYAFSTFGVRTFLNPDYTERSSSECAMEFAFQGQFLDSESGLMNYGYRYYSPQLGRWTCKDPIGEQGGANLYGMAGNDAVNWVDFLGLDPASPDGCLYVWIPVLSPDGKKRARPSHVDVGHRPLYSSAPVTMQGTRQEGDWNNNGGSYDPSTGMKTSGQQGKLYECCCLKGEEYKTLQRRIAQLRDGKIPEGSIGAGGELPTGSSPFTNHCSPSGVPYNCATAVSMAMHGLGGMPTSNAWDKNPSTLAPGEPGDDPFFRPVAEVYKQMEDSVKAGKCKIVHNGVPAGNPYS